MEERLTVGEALNKSTAYLQSKGRESSRLSAELLLAHVLSTDRLNVYLRFEAPLEQPEVVRLRELIARRGRGEPVAYLVGRKEFMGWAFEVDPSVLIPRPDSELLVEKVSECIGEGEALVLDIGCGSGCLLLSILKRCPGCRGVGVDISQGALAVTRRNAEALELQTRLTLAESDLFAGVNPADRGRFDWIISNPPYVRDDEWDALAVEIREYEPRQALLAGPDGLAVYRRLIAEASAWLKPGGRLALEFSRRTMPGVLALLEEAGFTQVEVFEDLGKEPRLAMAAANAPR